MTTSQIVGAVLVAMPLLAFLGFLFRVMVEDMGWRITAVLWLVVAWIIGCITVGAMLLEGSIA